MKAKTIEIILLIALIIAVWGYFFSGLWLGVPGPGNEFVIP
jgi:hypothetical protein